MNVICFSWEPCKLGKWVCILRVTPADVLDKMPPWYFRRDSDPRSVADGGTAPLSQTAWRDSGHAELYLNNTTTSCTPSQRPVRPALSKPALWSPETVANQKVQRSVTTAITVQQLYTVELDSRDSNIGTVRKCKGGNITQGLLISYLKKWTLNDGKRAIIAQLVDQQVCRWGNWAILV